MPRVGIAWAPTPDTSVNVGFAMANDVLYDNLGILSLPPQVQQTCDVVDFRRIRSRATIRILTSWLPAACPARQFRSPILLTAVQPPARYIPNQTLPYSETWTAGVQHIFANKYTLEVRYVELAASICRYRPASTTLPR